jgi:uncharacterized repeat protein (TIGR03803 family)
MRTIRIARWAWLCALALVATGSAQAQSQTSRSSYTFTVVHTLKGPPDGAFSWSGLVRAPDGNLYGSTWAGGTHPNCAGGLGVGCGTLFRLDSSGKERAIYSFVGLPGPIHLYGELLPSRNGDFYGLTNEGGTSTACYNGCGTIFHLDEKYRLTVLYNFGANGGTSDANWPAGDLVRDKDGNLYGTSSAGGYNNDGTIFKFSKSGVESVLYRFTGGSDGAGPSADLLLDSAGNLYGTAASGGGSCNCGTVFKLDHNGVLAVLYTFPGGTAGANPLAGLTRDSAGNFYGITAGGGLATCGGNYGCGTVFKLASDGTESVLHAFSGNPDGELPVSLPTRDAHGNLYGVTYVGGDSACGDVGCGVVYEVTPEGKERVLHAFSGGKEGALPWGPMYINRAGELVGTTQEGGKFDLCSNGCGIVYKLSPR